MDDYKSILKMKLDNRPFVLKKIDEISENKKGVFSSSPKDSSICFVGHSQLDQWDIEELNGYKIRNCAISGITSFEYNELILQKQMLNCGSDCFIVMHGTNDIVWDYSVEEIAMSIKETIDYIRNKTNAPIIFIACTHVNGRIDRSNARIDELNSRLKAVLLPQVTWLDTGFFDNSDGVFDRQYTEDGLHLTGLGYELLKTKIIEKMKEIGL